MAVGDDIAAALKAATKDLHAEKKRRDRDARRAARYVPAPADRVTLRDAVFEVIPAAVAATSGNGAYQFPCRNLFYAVRPRIQAYTDAELKYNYFSQDLVVEYEQAHGPIDGMYREPRGTLHEPHTGTTVPLGTLEVAAYRLPEYVFDKILYVEKEGLGPIFESARLAERFDLAIAAGKGQPVEAVRALFERAEAGDYRLFVLHDADPAGYSIARTIAEETDRMPDYSVDVIDLGLTVGDAIQRSLERHDAAGKIVPPAEVLDEQARDKHRDTLSAFVEDYLAQRFDLAALTDTLAGTFPLDTDTDLAQVVTQAHSTDRATWWKTAVNTEVGRQVDEQDERIRTRLAELLAEHLRAGGEP